MYSTCCAVQNMWLAARAEGIGVGWVSVLKMSQLRKILGIPHHVIPVAYLCIGYPVEYLGEPLLQTAGWRDRLPLSELLHYDRLGKHRSTSGLVRFLTSYRSRLNRRKLIACPVQEPPPPAWSATSASLPFPGPGLSPEWRTPRPNPTMQRRRAPTRWARW